MSERVVYDCDKCGAELEEPEPFNVLHADKSWRIDLCHKCAIFALASVLNSNEQKDCWNGTRFINAFGGLTKS